MEVASTEGKLWLHCIFFCTLYRYVSDVFSFGIFSKNRAASTYKTTTSVVGAVPEPSQPEPEIFVTTTEGVTTSAVDTKGKLFHREGLQISREAVASGVKEASSSIDDMIKELSQAAGSEIPMINAGGASTGGGDVVEELSRP